MTGLLDLMKHALTARSRRSGARESRSQFFMLSAAVLVGVGLPFSWVYMSERGEARYLAQIQELDARRARGEETHKPEAQNEAAVVMDMVNARRASRGQRPFPYGASQDVVLAWFKEGAAAALAAEAEAGGAGSAPAAPLS